MSSIDIIKEIAPALARRRIERGFRWLMERESTFPVSIWLMNPRISIPRDPVAREEGHLLCIVFCGNSFVAGRPKRTFSELVAEHGLTEQFLIAHGFLDDGIIDEAMLDFCWHEAHFTFHLERDLQRAPSALTPALRRELSH